MSRRGNCYDNAPIESFWGTLKNELVYHYNYETRQQATSDVVKYIELEYNQTRIQKGLDFKSPRQIYDEFYRYAAWLKSPKLKSTGLTAEVRKQDSGFLPPPDLAGSPNKWLKNKIDAIISVSIDQNNVS